MLLAVFAAYALAMLSAELPAFDALAVLLQAVALLTRAGLTLNREPAISHLWGEEPLECLLLWQP